MPVRSDLPFSNTTAAKDTLDNFAGGAKKVVAELLKGRVGLEGRPPGGVLDAYASNRRDGEPAQH